MTELTGRRCAVITGASSGIGLATAKILANQGWDIIAHGRDAARSEVAEAEIRLVATGGARVDMLRCDLSLLADTARLAKEIAGLTPRVDALVNNAGGVRSSMIITQEGNEVTFASNHLGHFLLTRELLPLLRATAAAYGAGAARVVSVSSFGHAHAPAIDWDDLQGIRNWVSTRNYCSAKLYNVLFTRELARRTGPDGIVANAMHPGSVASNFINHGTPEHRERDKAHEADRLPPEISAGTIAWLASAAETGRVTGKYFFDYEEEEISAAAQDDLSAARLWEASEKLLAREPSVEFPA